MPVDYPEQAFVGGFINLDDFAGLKSFEGFIGIVTVSNDPSGGFVGCQRLAFEACVNGRGITVSVFFEMVVFLIAGFDG